MNDIEIDALFDLEKTIAAKIFDDVDYPWEVLTKLNDFILKLGNELPQETFLKKGDDVWIAKTAKVADTVSIEGPCIIDGNAEVRHSAYIRGNVIIGKEAVVGNSTEIKNSILFDNVQVPHFNYVGDSILGFKTHFGAGAITSNVKSDKTLVTIKCEDELIETKLKKLGAIVGDYVEVGCNSVLCPGTVIFRNTTIYPIQMIRGVIGGDLIYKDKNNIVKKLGTIPN